ncbi:hypothetical protein [Vibrio parahaemolyticus]|uniref:hypothetical protein n=1 Tax=Vibrio parahaemolyticus TaxID=670 RepID=UPI003DA99A4E
MNNINLITVGIALAVSAPSVIASIKAPHNAGSYNKVIKVPSHMNQTSAVGLDDTLGSRNISDETIVELPTVPDDPVGDFEIPKPGEDEDEAVDITINCGCASVNVARGACFSPKRAKSAMDSKASGYFSSSYGSYWPNSSNIDFLVTYNLETKGITKIAITDHSKIYNLTDEIANAGLFEISGPVTSTATPSCRVSLTRAAFADMGYYKMGADDPWRVRYRGWAHYNKPSGSRYKTVNGGTTSTRPPSGKTYYY